MEYQLSPKDEYPHPPSDAENFNESVYLSAFDFGSGIGGWMRLGNRVNEGHAELAVCIYLADGRIACQFKRPEITHNRAFAAGGLEYDVSKPFEAIEVEYSGEVLLVDDPQLFRDPKRLFKACPRIDAVIHLSCAGISPMHGGIPTDDDTETMYGREFSLGHFYQHVSTKGHMIFGNQRHEIDGYGWRDHSWGPRTWQNIRFHRLLTGAFDDGSGFCVLKIANNTNIVRRYGVFLFRGGYEEIVDFDVLSEWNGLMEPTKHRLRLRTAKRSIDIEGTIKRLAPLSNNKREGNQKMSIQICEGITEWSMANATGYGMSEFGDLLVDNRLAGYPL